MKKRKKKNRKSDGLLFDFLTEGIGQLLILPFKYLHKLFD